MKEVINVSFSQKANHLNSHFYNFQENYIDYTDPRNTKIDLDVYNECKINQNGTVSYEPRMMLWDLKNGFLESICGSSSSNNDSLDNMFDANNLKYEKIMIDEEKPGKSEFQKALDNNKPEDQKVDINRNSTYWSDYFKMVINKKKFNYLQNYQLNNPKDYNELQKGSLIYDTSENAKQSSKGSFLKYSIGIEEFKSIEGNIEDYLDEKFLPMLEKCDNFKGINLSADVDSSWSSFSYEFIKVLKDEFVGNKRSVFMFGLFNQLSNDDLFTSKQYELLENRVRSLNDLLGETSLFFPLHFPILNTTNSGLDFLNLQFKKNLWFETSVECLVYDTVMNTFSTKEENFTMDDLESSVTLENPKRNLVNDIRLNFGDIIGTNISDSTIDLQVMNFTKKLFEPSRILAKLQKRKFRPIRDQDDKVYSKNLIIRKELNAMENLYYDEQDEIIIKHFGKFEELLNTGTPASALKIYEYLLGYNKSTLNTYPRNVKSQILSKNLMAVSLQNSSSMKSYFKDSAFCLQRLQSRKRLMSNSSYDSNDECNEAIECLFTLSKEYLHPYDFADSNDDDSEDDFY